jgi:N-acetylglucosamine kinase
MDDTGKVLNRGEAGASNYQSVGIQAALSSIESAIAQATEHREGVKVEAICLGLAGVGRPQDIQVIQGLVEQLKTSNSLAVSWALQPTGVVICSDAEIALVGGLGYNVGIVAIAGTGSIVFGRNRQGETKRVGGWGHIIGDSGSAYHIAVSGLRAVLRAYDDRAEPTSLQQLLLQHLSLGSVEDLVEVVYRRGWGVTEIAALAPIVDRAASEGDLVASAIVEQAVQELVKSTLVVIDAIFSRDEAVEIVTTGSVWLSQSKLNERFAASIVALAPLAKVIYPRHEPAYGAGLLALKH